MIQVFFFAAYVNEENPMIDQLLREALNTRIVNRFLGYQSKAKGAVDKQVYALLEYITETQIPLQFCFQHQPFEQCCFLAAGSYV